MYWSSSKLLVDIQPGSTTRDTIEIGSFLHHSIGKDILYLTRKNKLIGCLVQKLQAFSSHLLYMGVIGKNHLVV